MLLWINGPFGGGKTATAYELNRRLPGSVVCDPEHVGFGMRRMLPAALRGNFQDLPAWRHSVVELLRLTLAGYDGPVIVPMALADPGYFREVIGSLRQDGFAVHHFALLAEPATVRAAAGQAQPGNRGQARQLDGRAPGRVSPAAQRTRVRRARPHRRPDRRPGRRGHRRLGRPADQPLGGRPAPRLAARVRDDDPQHPVQLTRASAGSWSQIARMAPPSTGIIAPVM
jgi:hypothetical protein